MTRTKLMCLPHAGAGAGLYRPWQDYESDVLRVVPVQLPGREELFTEPPYGSMSEAAARCAERVLNLVCGSPFALYGHSFGAVLAFEVARELVAANAPWPTRLVVGGAADPATTRPSYPATLDDDDLVAWVRRGTGAESDLWSVPELRGLLLPTLRADVALLSGYQADLVPLPFPITALRGVDDDAVPAEACLRWQAWTSSSFELIELPGGHLYFTEDWPRLWRTLESAVRRPERNVRR
ncbi:surfactin synthase thioesterase subunit [Saccharothrix tamanrassetensis]|uniref:Surfactin synthase thioesterase subunit n=1 Tax=Saccharothrix tamanrassetensis TaxID=1051531 RepID=A0A841CBX2_9PSEU|nr:alpha/beta fold hydrolase [Saccharothrix tamanrassetensis]MBB5953677.1 surfactin synthase thioesterase subunit [Saccharothrix tamanrassetensis]